MSIATRMSAIFAVAAVVVAAPASAQVSEEWLRSEPKDASYSVEIPCTADAVAAGSAAIESSRPEMNKGSVVACVDGGAIFSVGRVGMDGGPVTENSVFDTMLRAIGRTELPNVELTQVTVSGRRAIFSREYKDGGVAQTGIVEISNGSYLMVLGGGIPELGEVPEDIEVMIDRFFASLEVDE